MTTYIVTRHTGALQWILKRLGTQEYKFIPHLDRKHFVPGDRVCGVLPLAAAARICAEGAEPHVIRVDVPFALRGQELSEAQLDELGASLVRYEVREIARR